MVRLSIVIITFNEEKNLARCLASVQGIADEIVIVDSNSTDSTPEIAKGYGAKVVTHDFLGYAAQKNFATAQAENDWVLSLDADEELSDELRASIQKVKENPAYDVYEMPRLTNYCGKWIRYCGWYPDRQTRLYNRKKGKWEEKKVHEYWRLDQPGSKGLLKGDLLHYSFTSISQHIKKIERYTELAAMDAVERGKDAGFLKIVFSPKWHFFTEFVIKLGFLDGFYGYTVCKLSAYSAFIKYSKIRMYNRVKR